MEELFLQQYDSHVKAHQRYLLLKLLDEAKSEAMEQLLAQQTPLPTERVYVPRPETETEPLEFEAAVDLGNAGILTSRDIPAPARSVIPELVPDNALFDSIAPCTVQPPAVTLSTEATIDCELFSGIPTGEFDLPQPAAVVSPDVSVADTQDLLPAVTVPSAAFSYQPAVDDAFIDFTIPAPSVVVPAALPSVVTESQVLADVALPQVTMPAVTVPQPSADAVLTGNDLPQVAIPAVTMPQLSADASLTGNDLPQINLPQGIGDFAPEMPESVALPRAAAAAVSLPELRFPSEAFRGIAPASVVVPQAEVADAVMTPPERMTVSVPSVNRTMPSIPEQRVSLPKIEVPQPAVSKVTLPQLQVEPFAAAVPVVKIPAANDVLDALSREQAHMTAP